MLKMKQQCERCQQGLPADQTGAYICSFECTFCASCAGDMNALTAAGNCCRDPVERLSCLRSTRQRSYRLSHRSKTNPRRLAGYDSSKRQLDRPVHDLADHWANT